MSDKEVVRKAIVDWDGNNILASVVQSTDDPTKYGLVICNPDWSPIWWGTVESVVAWTGIVVDNTDTANPIVSIDNTVVTADSTDTLTNKTLDSYTNFIHADWIHLRVKAKENLVYWDVLMFVWFNAGEQAIEVSKRDDINVPAIWVLHDTLDTGEFGMAVSNGLFKNIDTSTFAEWTILYPDDLWWFTDTNPWWYAQQIAYVVRSHAVNGEIMLNVWPVYETDLSDYYTKTETDALLDTKLSDTFESISKNLKAYPYTLNYTSTLLTSIVYTIPAWSITKTLNRTWDKITSIVLSWDTPSWIDLTKTLTYTGDALTSISYS